MKYGTMTMNMVDCVVYPCLVPKELEPALRALELVCVCVNESKIT